MSSRNHNPLGDDPSESAPSNGSRFAFGSMALAEEEGRGAPSQTTAGNPSASTAEHSPTNETIDILRMVVLNEQFSPEILPYQTDTIESMRTLVTTQTEVVDTEEDEAVEHSTFESQLKRMELDRINYMLRHYLRLRIKKIEKNIVYIFKGDGPYDFLSQHEKRFAVGYSDLVEDHFKKSFLSLLPDRLQVMEKDGNVDPATPPKLDRFVFCRVRNEVGSYVIGEDATDDSLELNRGDIICIRYKAIRELLKREDVELL